jgi:hypothetical protein
VSRGTVRFTADGIGALYAGATLPRGLKMSSADDMAVAPGLDLTLVDVIAQRVLELLGDRNGDEIQLLTVAQVARRFQVHPSWVYANARRLGALRLGTGPKAPLRFDPRRVALAVEDSPPSGRRPRERTPAREAAGAPRPAAIRRARGLLPIADG